MIKGEATVSKTKTKTRLGLYNIGIHYNLGVERGWKVLDAAHTLIRVVFL